MQVSKIMIAVAALTVGSSVFAAPAAGRIAISSGASATKGNLLTALSNICAGVLTPFSPSGLNNTGNITSYVCSPTALTSASYAAAATTFTNFTGTNFAELRLNVTGGSFTAVCALNNWPASTSCGTVNSGSAPDRYVDPATLGTVLPQAGQVIVGGLMDVAPDTFIGPAGVTNGLALPAASDSGVAQTFGVAVSPLLYGAMFANQQAPAGTGATVDKPIPGAPACSVTDTDKLHCVPTISKGQMATIMAGNEFNVAYANGAGFLGGSALNGTVLEYNRRADTSGTQAAAQAYFLGLPCSPNPLPIVGAPAVGSSRQDGNILVFAHAGTGDVRARLNTAGVYGIGIISGENNQTGQFWKWLRVQGAAIGENATPTGAGITNRQSVKNGSYDFYFESKVVPGNAPGAATFWGAVTGALNTLTAPVGLLNSADLAGYYKAGNACQGNSSN